MSNFTLICTNQRKQRKQYITHDKTTYVRNAIVSPYNYDSSGELIHSKHDLDMRRKSEILKYKNTSNSGSNGNKWAYLSRNSSASRRACPPTKIYTSTASSDVPGKEIMLYNDDSIPLYNYGDNSTNIIAYQHLTFDDYNRPYDIYPYYNVTGDNATGVTFTDIVIVNPDKNILSFGFTIPISIAYKGHFDDTVTLNKINCIQLYVVGAKMDIYYSDSIVNSADVTYNSFSDDDANNIKPFLSTDLFVSCDVITVSFDWFTQDAVTGEVTYGNSVTGDVSVTQLLGSIRVPNLNISAVSQYVYSYKLTVNVAYAEYSVDDVTRNAYRTNFIDGEFLNESITNTSIPPPSSLTNIQISAITNVEDVYSITNTNPIQNKIENCVISVSNKQLKPADVSNNIPENVSYNYHYIESNDVTYVPFAVHK
jgi:hypothetical protein